MQNNGYLLRNNSGFTLIEMVIVIIIAGALLAAGATGMQALLQKTEFDTTKTSLDTLHGALALHHKQSGILPCPASLTVTPGSAPYGIADDCSAAPAAGLTSTGRGGRKVRIGMIPFKSLNLPEEIAYDAWGRRLTYAVTEQLAKTPADFDPQEGAIVIQDSNGNDLTEKPGNGMYVIFSGGEDGLGAYSRAGTVFDTCIGDSNAHDGENCDNDAVFVKTEFSTAEDTTHYDDVFAYASRILGEDDSSPDPIFNCTDQTKIFLPGHPDADSEGCANIFPTCAANQYARSNGQKIECVDFPTAVCSPGEAMVGITNGVPDCLRIGVSKSQKVAVGVIPKTLSFSLTKDDLTDNSVILIGFYNHLNNPAVVCTHLRLKRGSSILASCFNESNTTGTSPTSSCTTVAINGVVPGSYQLEYSPIDPTCPSSSTGGGGTMYYIVIN